MGQENAHKTRLLGWGIGNITQPELTIYLTLFVIVIIFLKKEAH